MPPLPKPISGYPQLAHQMGLFPETAIFKRFGDLSARNLLYLQAELLHMHINLRELEEEERDAVHKGNEKGKGMRYAADWYELYNSRKEADNESDQWDLILEIRAKLKEYEKSLIRAHTIASLESPARSDLEDLQDYLYSSEMRPPLHGMDSDVWGHNDDKSTRKHHAPDLTAVRTRQMEDPFTKLVMTTLIKPFFSHIGRHFKKVNPMLGVAAYADESMRNFTRFVATFLASTMLLASINALYFISSMVVRLGAISAFNIVFALCLMVFAKARPIEVFSTTSAFTAVQVVFIATSGPSSNSTTAA